MNTLNSFFFDANVSTVLVTSIIKVGIHPISNSFQVFPGLTAIVKYDDHAVTWYDHRDSYSPWYEHGDSYSPWYDHGKIMACSS